MNLLLPMLVPIVILWAAPWTLLGCAIGVLGLATGGGMQRRGRVLEFHGGVLAWLLARAPIESGAMAITFGHTVLGRTPAALDVTRRHELVHVRQYEHWGPLFGPAYLLCSAVQWLRGKDAYRDNPFERQAFDEES